MLNALWKDATNGKLEAIDRALKISDRRARLLGLDKPIKVAATDTAGDDLPGLSVDEAVDKLTGIFERARARMAAPVAELPETVDGDASEVAS
jgi:hypothetical protein